MFSMHVKVSGAKGVMSHSLGNKDVGTLYIEQKDAARSDERDCKYHPNHAPISFCSSSNSSSGKIERD